MVEVMHVKTLMHVQALSCCYLALCLFVHDLSSYLFEIMSQRFLSGSEHFLRKVCYLMT